MARPLGPDRRARRIAACRTFLRARRRRALFPNAGAPAAIASCPCRLARRPFCLGPFGRGAASGGRRWRGFVSAGPLRPGATVFSSSDLCFGPPAGLGLGLGLGLALGLALGRWLWRSRLRGLALGRWLWRSRLRGLGLRRLGHRPLAARPAPPKVGLCRFRLIRRLSWTRRECSGPRRSTASTGG